MKKYPSIVGLWSNFFSWIKASILPQLNEDLKPPSDGVADIEDALTFTKFGKFNVLLLAFSIPAAVASIYDTTTMSYVLTSAECDLQLSYMQKGMLNATVHLGMITAAFLSGYITDTLGRRKTLIYGFLLDAICNLIAAFSISFEMLAICKFLTGFLMSGPCTVIISCLSEFFSKNVRPMFVMYVGFCFSLGSFTIPFIAWGILTNPTEFYITSDYVIHSWQIFIAVCSIPSLLSGLLAILLPETPRFLASKGNPDEAVNVLKKVYAINTGCSPDTYPIKHLTINTLTKNENSDENMENEGCIKTLCGSCSQMKPLFRKPYIYTLLLAFIIEYGCISGCSFRLWLPQLFKMMSESVEGSLCEMISLGNNANILKPIYSNATNCEPIKINPETFENAAIVAGVQVVLCTIAGFAINMIGKKTLLMSTLLLAGTCCSSMYFCTSAKQATMLAAIVVAFSAIASNATISSLIDIIPTSLRATATSSVLMIGRIGSITGNMVFPVLLALGCLPAFFSLGFLLIGCSLFAVLLPKPQKGMT